MRPDRLNNRSRFLFRVAHPAIAFAGIAAALCAIPHAAAQSSDSYRLTAGPVYTSNSPDGGPRYPHVEILVHLVSIKGPQLVQPADLSLYSGSRLLARGSSLREFNTTTYGVKSILALDLSGSMSGKPLEAVRNTIANFVNDARKQDRVEVLSFANETRVEVPFGSNHDELASRLREVTSRGTETHLYDAILDAIAQFDDTAPTCRQLTVISDGHDEGSTHTIDDVIRQALARKVPVDAIGLTRSHPEYLQSLIQIAQATHGSYARAQSPDDLTSLINMGITNLRGAPVVSFQINGLPADGKLHSLELRWTQQNLSTTVDVQTPVGSSSLPLIVWILLACFVLGLALLMLARHRSRERAVAEAEAARAVHIPPPVPPAPVRTPTFVEEPAPKPDPEPKRAETVIEEDKQLQHRPRTRVPVFFDSEKSCTLEALSGPVAGQSFIIRGEMTVGALDVNQIAIADDPTLSGFHARLRLADDVLTIEDTRSTNGTYVNGERLGPQRKLLKPGDEIRMGRSTFRIRSE